jgi:uncharacterized membrane protein
VKAIRKQSLHSLKAEKFWLIMALNPALSLFFSSYFFIVVITVALEIKFFYLFVCQLADAIFNRKQK